MSHICTQLEMKLNMAELLMHISCDDLVNSRANHGHKAHRVPVRIKCLFQLTNNVPGEKIIIGMKVDNFAKI